MSGSELQNILRIHIYKLGDIKPAEHWLGEHGLEPLSEPGYGGLSRSSYQAPARDWPSAPKFDPAIQREWLKSTQWYIQRDRQIAHRHSWRISSIRWLEDLTQ